MNDILGILIDAGYLQSQFDAHTRDMWAYTMLVFMFGVGIGFALSRLFKGVEQRQRSKPTLSERRALKARRKEAVKELQLRNVDAWTAWARRLDPDNKLLLLYLMEYDHVDVRMDNYEFESCVTGMEQVLVINDIGPGTHRMRLSEGGRAIMAKFGDIIAEALPNSYSWWMSHMVDAEHAK